MCIPQNKNQIIIFLGYTAIGFLVHKILAWVYKQARDQLIQTEQRALIYAHARLNLKCHTEGCVSLHRPIN